MTFLPWYWIHFLFNTSNECDFAHSHQKRNGEKSLFITAPFILPVFLKVYTCFESSRNGLIYVASGLGKVDLMWASVSGGCSLGLALTGTATNKKGLPCTVCCDRTGIEGLSLKDMRKKKMKKRGCEHLALFRLLPFLSIFFNARWRWNLFSG